MRNEGETGVTVKVQEIDVMKVDKFKYLGPPKATDGPQRVVKK